MALLVPAVARVRAGQQRRRWPCQQQLRSVAGAGAAPAAPGADLRATPMPTAGPHLAPFRHQRLRRSADGRTADCRGTTCVDGRATSYTSIWVCIGSNPSYIWVYIGSNPSYTNSGCIMAVTRRLHQHLNV